MLRAKFPNWLKQPVIFLIVVTLTLGIGILGKANGINAQQVTQPIVEQRTKQNTPEQKFSGVPLVVSCRFKIKPEQRDEFFKLANVALQETAKEPDAISYNLYEDTDSKNSFIFFEEWTSREALDTHLQKNYTKKLLDKFPQLIDGKPTIKVYKVQSVGSLSD